MELTSRLRAAAKRIKHDALTVYFVARNPNTPTSVRLLALAIAAYAMSPIDLIPDFIPVLGYLDDVVLLPLAIWLVVKLTPVMIIERCRAQSAAVAARPVSISAAVVVMLVWLSCAAAFAYWIMGWVGG